MSVSDDNENVIVNSIAVLPGVDLFGQFLAYAVPQNPCIIYNTKKKQDPPTRDDFGTINVLLYNEIEE
jgi:hypothetical protein